MTWEPPTAEESDKLALLHQRVYKFYPETDVKLLRWLRARDMDVTKAEQMLKKHLVWQKYNEISTLKEWHSPKVFFPYLHTGYDKQGVPVFIMPVGQYDLLSIVDGGYIISSTKFIYQFLENILNDPNNQRTLQATIIFDYQNFDYRQIAHRAVIAGILQVVKIFEANYPELLKSAYVINAPKIFHYLFSLVRPLMNMRTLSKFHIYGSSRIKWEQILLDSIPSDQLPCHWGGSKVGQDDYCSEAWFTEPLPPNYFKRIGSTCDESGNEWCTIKIPPKEKIIFEHSTLKDKAKVLIWAFRTDGYDLGFSIHFDEEEEFLVEYKRVESHLGKIEGQVDAVKTGKYTIVFDNTYSRSKGKTLHYFIQFVDAEESK